MSALRDIRKARRMTLEGLGKAVGLTKSGVDAIERREPDGWRQVGRFATALSCTTDALLGRTANLPVVVDALGRADRALLEALQREAEDYLGPQFLKWAGGWRPVVCTAFAGALVRMRDLGKPPTGDMGRPIPLPPVEDMVKAPPEWYTGWESERQKLRDRALPDPKRQRALPVGR
jgi:transcriptional regulator with XRE-family HTH domain